MRYVSSVLIVTYLLAMLFKMLLTQKVLERVGICRMLPAAVLPGLLTFGGLRQAGATDSVLLLYFCGLYLGLEMLRRAVFDPVFLVLFQPLTPPGRLRAPTRAKGFYEPLGTGLGGILLFVLHDLPGLNEWVPFVWMGLFAAGALFFVHRTCGHYMAELQHALGRRFGEAADTETPDSGFLSEDQRTTSPGDVPAWIEALQDKARRKAATAQLRHLGPAALRGLIATLSAADAPHALARRMAQRVGGRPLPQSRTALVALVRQPSLHRCEAALRALRHFAPQPAEAPVFQALVQQEMRLFDHLLASLQNDVVRDTPAPNDCHPVSGLIAYPLT